MAKGEADGPTHSEKQLQDIARRHLRYEVHTLVEQVRRWERWHGPRDALYDALIEASLVHLRILDDFLCRKPQRDDVSAVHFAPRWRPGDHSVLSVEERDSLNAQLFHLVVRREDAWGAALPRLMERACLVFCEFMAHVDDEGRRRALAQAHAAALRGLLADS